MQLQLAKSNFINYCEYEKGLSLNTRKSYLYELNDYLQFLEKEYGITNTSSIKKEHIEAYLKDCYQRLETSKTVAHKLTTVRNFHQYLEKEEQATQNPTVFIDRPKTTKSLPKCLSIEEVDKLLDIPLNTPFDYRNKAMLELMYGSGLRVSELINLTVYDLDFNNATIIIKGKGNKERLVPLGEVAIYYLEQYLTQRPALMKKKRCDALFLNARGTAIS